MLKKYDERKMKNLGDIESLARSHTKTAIRVLAGIMREPTVQPMARVAAAKALLDRGWGCMSSEHFGQLAWQFKGMSGSSGLKVQAAIAC